MHRERATRKLHAVVVIEGLLYFQGWFVRVGAGTSHDPTAFRASPSCESLVCTPAHHWCRLIAYRTLRQTGVPILKKRDFDPTQFLATIGNGRRVLVFRKKKAIFTQGDQADAVFYIQKGKVKLTVVSQIGKEATLGILGEGDFFGEGALAGQSLRMGSVTTMTDCDLLKIDKKAMIEALHREQAFSDLFVAYLLARNIRYQEDLVDQLFNSSEKRLARILLLLAHFGKEGVPETVIPKISQETLAEMIGTTRPRVSFFMNRFRKLGFLQYDSAAMQVHSSLLNVVLHD